MSEEKKDELGDHTFGAFAYERVLSEAASRRVEHVQRQLQSSLDGIVHVWVRDARPFAHNRDSSIQPLHLRLHPSFPVAEVRDRIQERYEEENSYRERIDGPLQLFFDGRALEDGKLLAEYLRHSDNQPQTSQKQPRWPTPFAGILWVVPFRVATALQRNSWGA